MRARAAAVKRYRVEPLEPRVLLAADWTAGLAPSWSPEGEALAADTDLFATLSDPPAPGSVVPGAAAAWGSPVEAPQAALDLEALRSLVHAGPVHAVPPAMESPGDPVAAASAGRHELVVIDAGISGYEQLLADLHARASEDVRLDVHVIDAGADGVQALSEILSSYDALDAVHVLSHGSEHGLQLGASWLDAASADRDAAAISAWSTALADGADLLLYGCNLASSPDGLALVQRLAGLTGADVAASEDLTGASGLGGDWHLEYASGAIEAAAPFSTPAQQDWQGVLAYVEGFESWIQSGAGWQVTDLSAGAFNVPANAVLEIAIANSNTSQPQDVGLRAVGSSIERLIELNESPGSGLRDYAVMHVQADAASRIETHAEDPGQVEFTLLGYWDSGSYVELDPSTAKFSATASGVWEDFDLSFHGVGAGDVAEILITNKDGDDAWKGGVRSDGSSLDRTVGLDSRGGGVDASTLFVQAGPGVTATIEVFAEDNSELEFLVLGYWSTPPGTYTEAADDIGSPALANTWHDVDLGTFGVPAKAVVEVAVADAAAADVNDYGLGVRENGSVLDRVAHPVADLGADGLRMHVVADASSGIEIFHEQPAEAHEFRLLGYWSNVVAPDPNAPLWLSTRGDVTNGGQPGDDTWQDEDLVLIGDPNLALGPTTNGTFAVAFDTTLYAPTADLNATHYVTRNMAVGAASFQLKAGDLLLSAVDDASTFTSSSAPGALGFTNNLTVNNEDVFVFRPDVFGDYSAGTFAMLLDNATGTGADVTGISLIERDVTVGDADLEAGDFLYTRFGNNDVFLFDTLQVGTGITNGARGVLLEGGDPGISISNNLFGIDVVEKTVTLGGQVLASGTVLLTSEFSQNVGTNNLPVTDFDVYALDVKKTTLVSGVSNGLASASMVFDGSDVGFNTGAEQLRSITLTTTHNAAPSLTPKGPSLTDITEDDTGNFGDLVSAIVGTSISDDDAGDPQGIAVTSLTSGNGTWEYSIDAGSSWNPVGAVAESNALLLRATDRVRFVPDAEMADTAKITYRAWDQSVGAEGERADAGNFGGTTAFSKAIDTAGITVSAVNDAPTLSLPARAFINEFHYDNVGSDTGEAVEIAAPAGTDLTGFSLVFYNGFTGNAYRTEPLSGVIADQGDSFGTLVVNLPANGIENAGSGADGIALVDGGGVVLEFISYEGSLVAVDGPAAGMVSTDIGVSENGATPVGHSLQLTGAGPDFTWTAAAANTLGAANTGQSFAAAADALEETVVQDGSLAFGVATSNAITVVDVDELEAGAADPLAMSLSVVNGTVTLGSTTGLFDVLGDGSSTLTFQGTAAEINAAMDGLSYQPNPGFSGTDRLTILVDDQGNSGPPGALGDKGQVTIVVTPPSVMWLTTKDDEAPSDALGGGENWRSGDVVKFGDGATFGTSPSTSGTFANQFSFTGINTVTSNPEQADLRALHYVGTSVPLGSGGDTFTVQAGDVIAAIDNTDTIRLTSSNASTIDVTRKDVFVFRPDTAGDYSSGVFTLLMTNPFGKNIHAITLVEEATHLGAPEPGDVNLLQKGDFLVAYSGLGDHDDVYKFTASKVVTATDAGTPTRMLEGSALGFSDQVQGLDLVERNTELGDTTLTGGQLLMSLSNANTVAGLAVDPHDVLILDITGTEEGAGTAAAATMLFDGSDVDLDSANETIDGLTLARPGSVGGVSNQLPAAQVLDEDTVLSFSPGAGNAITVSDGTGGDTDLRVTLSVTDGTLTLSGTAGLTFVGGADGTATMTFTGLESAINAALDGLTYAPAGEWSGAATLAVDTELAVVPVALYTFEDPLDTGNDDSPGAANDGVPISTSALDDPTRGNVLEFDGVDSRVRIPGTFGQPASLTMAGWVNLDAGYDNGEVISLGNNVGLRLDNTGGGSGVTGFFFDGVGFQATFSGTLVSGTGWRHVAFTMDAATDEQIVYVDGIEVGRTTHTQSISYSLGSDTYLGRHGNVSSYFLHGLLDDVHVYDSALSADAVTVLAVDGVASSGGLAITVNPVNDEPSFTVTGNQSVNEDSGPHTVAGFATPAPGGGADEAGQSFSYTVSNDNAGLFAVGPAIDASGQLTYTLNPNVSGTATVTVSVRDDGGTANGGDDTSPDQTFDIVVAPVNDEPSFNVAGNQSVNEDSGPHTVAGFATPAPGGGADEAGQSFSYTVSDDNAGLFAVGPAIDASGTLTYTLNPNVSGTATVTVSVRDDGGTANGGDDISPDQTFRITVAPVNDEPSFTTLGNQAVAEDSGPHTVAGFATPAAGGGADEAGQSFTYAVSNNNAGLFAVGPAIDASGTLTYTLNPNVSGAAAVTVLVRDDGGTANGGDDTSGDQIFDIVVASVNDEPSFTTLGNQNVDEDSGPHTVVGFATPAAGGGTDESGQSFTYMVSNGNASLFAVGPAIDASGQLTYTLNPNVSGTATVTVSVRDDGGTANGGDDTSPDQTFDIVVAPVNDEPSFTVAGNQSVNEDSGPHTVAGFATPAPGGGADEAGQSFTYTVSNDNAGLFAVGPAIDASGTLTYTLNSNVSGTAAVTVSVRDDGGTTNGGDDTSGDQIFDIVVAPVNDEPSFTTLGDQSVLEDSGLHAVAGFATPAAGGGTDEAGQSFSYTVSNDNAALFAVGPTIDASGTLTYTLSPNVSGTATVTVSVRDDGGTANGGDDTSPDQTFDIVVNPVNDEPSFTVAGNQSVNEDSGPHTVAGFATPAAGGGADEAGQSFSYTASNDNAALFAVGPTIDASGTLTYTLNPNVSGTATVTVSVRDDGGTANGGDDTSPDQTFDIVVNPVNDEPSFNILGNQTVDEDSGPHTVAGFATPAAGGGADESGQSFTFTVSNDTAGLFAVGPAIDASGTLTYTLNPNVSGTATVTVSVRDSGGTANGGDDTSPDQTFDIGVASVNDEPSFTTLGNQSVDEDSGPHTVAGFATPTPGGGAVESGQSFTYTVSNDNAGLFAVGPAIDASGQLTYTLNSNAVGTATVTVSVRDDGGTANGGDDTSPDQTFDIVVNPVNDEPSFNMLGNQNVDEDSGPHTVAGFATPAAGGGADEAGQSFSYTVSNDNAALFAVGPTIDASGTLTYTLNPNVSGTATVTVSVRDDGGTANGGDDTSPDQAFDIVVAPVNDEPSFTVAGNQSVNEDSGPHTVAGFATPAPGGGADEAGQSFTYTVSNDNAGLFAVGPAIDASGTLTYTLNSNVSGAAAVTVSVRDDGGTANGGDDSSGDQIFRITVAPVNDEPSFTTLGNQSVLENSGAHAIAGFATPSPGGGVDEAGQSFTYTVSNDNTALFAVAPVVDASGTLTYTLNPGVTGTATVTVTVRDDGGTANGGDDTSADQTFDIVVTAFNTAPSGADATHITLEDTAHVFTAGDFGFSDTDGHALQAVRIASLPGAGALTHNGSALSVGDRVSALDIAAGKLVFKPSPGASGAGYASFTFQVQDGGGTASGGVDLDPTPNTIIIDVTPVADPVVPPPDPLPLPDTDPDGPPDDPPPPEPEPPAPEPTDELAPTPSGGEVATPAAIAPVDLDSDGGGQADLIPPDLNSVRGDDRSPSPEVPIPFVPSLESPLDLTDLETADGERPSFVPIRADVALVLDRVRNSMDEESGVRRFELGQSTGAALGLSVGYVSWLLRGGVLLSSVLSSLPAWRFIDPLPVFSGLRSRRALEDGEDESLEEIVEGGPDDDPLPPASAGDVAARIPTAHASSAERPLGQSSKPTMPEPGP